MSGSVKVLVHARKTGQFNEQQLRENLAVFSTNEHPDAARWVINCQVHLAECCLHDGHAAEAALEYLETASRGYDSLGLVTGRPKLLRLFGTAYGQCGDVEKALSALSASLASYRHLGVSEGFADVCYAYGRALETSDQTAEARDAYRLGVSADPEMDNSCAIAQCQRRLGQLTSH